jgi:glyoxylase-like metal-dependent hydrolase (beta-lactamase superfamily II)
MAGDMTPTADDRAPERPERSDYRGLVYPLGRWAPAQGALHEVAPGVFWLRMQLSMALDHINLWVLEDGDGVALVDSGLNMPLCQEQWDAVFAGPLAGRRITRIIVTHYHPDHLGLAGWLTQRFDVALWMSRAEYLMAQMILLDSAPAVPDSVLRFHRAAGWPESALEDLKARGWNNFNRAVSPLPDQYVRLREGQRLRIGDHDWQIIMGSGHSPEHACLWQPERAVLIAGDQLLPRISSNVSVYPTEPDANPLADWFAGLDRLAQLPADALILPSHNEPYLGAPERARQLRADHEDKLDRLLTLIRAAPRTAVDCFETLFRRTPTGFAYALASGEALAHLHYLEAGKVIYAERGETATRWCVA